jgi:glycosyltransferase involved in cell wall biosynthesis
MSTIGIAGPVNIQSLASYLNVQYSIPLGLGGTVLQPLIIELIRRNHNLVLFTLDANVSNPVLLKGDKLRIWVCPYRKIHRARDFFARERAFIRKAILQEDRVDFLHAHWTYEFALAALDSGKPTLVTAHDAPLRILQYNPTPYWLMRILMAYSVAKKANVMSAVSKDTGRHFKNKIGYRKDITVIPNGLPVFKVDINSQKEKSNKIIFAGILSVWGRLKNTKTLIRAFSAVQKEIPQSELWLFGKGHGSKEEAENWAKYKRLEKNIRFMGSITHETVLKFLEKNINILVHPSLEESFSLVIAEAMMLGIPVIAGEKSGGVPATLNYGKAGWLVNVRSAKDLAHAMIKMAASPKVQSRLGESAKEYALNNYTIENVASLYENLYIELI